MIVMILQYMKTLCYCLYEIILVVAPPGNNTESIPDTSNAFKFLMTPRQQEPRKGKKGGRKGRKRSRLFKSFTVQSEVAMFLYCILVLVEMLPLRSDLC